MRSNQAYMIEN